MGGFGWGDTERTMPLATHPEALSGEPPGGRVWRRPLLAVVVGLLVIFVALFASDLVQGRHGFRVESQLNGDCRGVPVTERCWTVTVTNRGRTAAAATCRWDAGAFAGHFTTEPIQPLEDATRVIVSASTSSDPGVTCTEA